jgi:hypothetical protein
VTRQRLVIRRDESRWRKAAIRRGGPHSKSSFLMAVVRDLDVDVASLLAGILSCTFRFFVFSNNWLYFQYVLGFGQRKIPFLTLCFQEVLGFGSFFGSGQKVTMKLRGDWGR